MEQRSATKQDKLALKDRRVFLFEQIIIFSEEIDKRKNNLSSPGYIYKHSIKVPTTLYSSLLSVTTA